MAGARSSCGVLPTPRSTELNCLYPTLHSTAPNSPALSCPSCPILRCTLLCFTALPCTVCTVLSCHVSSCPILYPPVSGLRGAVAFACANIYPDTNGNRPLIVGTATAVILVTVFAFGALTVPVIGFLGIKTNVDAAAYVKSVRTSRTPLIASLCAVSLSHLSS